MVAETSVMRFSMVAQTSDLIRFTCELKAPMASSTVLLEGSSMLLLSASGASEFGVLEASGPDSGDLFFLPLGLTIVKNEQNIMLP